jgi:hypothetical protein
MAIVDRETGKIRANLEMDKNITATSDMIIRVVSRNEQGCRTTLFFKSAWMTEFDPGIEK